MIDHHRSFASSACRALRLAALSLVLFLASLTLSDNADARRYASIVIDGETGRVLHASNPDRRVYPASLTKIMTLYLTFEALESGKLTLDTKLKVSKRAAGQTPSKLGLRAGRTIRVEDAILALVTKSANDAATVLAEHLGGTESQFAQMMTRKARDLGMKRTTFRNASGLPNRRQLSTARDMATLAQAIQAAHPQYYHYFSRRKFSYGKRTFRNHNRLLSRYEGTDGIKTGYTRASGFNLVSSVERNGNRVIGVVIGGRTATSRDRHMRGLLDKAFRKIEREQAIAALMKVPTPPFRPQPGDGNVVAAIETASGDETAPELPVEQGSKTSFRFAPPNVDNQWAVQVGAFKQYESAQKRVLRAAGVLPDDLTHSAVSIEPFQDGDARLYRARLIGYDEDEARNACAALERKRIGCVPVPPAALASTDTVPKG